MSPPISRRGLLGMALAAGALPRVAFGASREPARLVAGTRVLEVNGRPAPVFGLVGPDGRPGLRLAPGERFRANLVNETGERTLIHWHGQLPPWMQDGFPWPQTPPIGQGAAQAYDYAPIAGTYWMHSHHEMQEQRLLSAPLIVHDAADLRDDRQDVVLMLHDFTFRTPDEVLAGLTGSSVEAAAVLGSQAEADPAQPGGNPSPASGAGGMSPASGAGGMSPASGAGGMAHMSMPGMPRTAMAMTSMSKAPPMPMDLNDVHYDAFLANDRTLADPEVVRIDGGGRVRLRIINGACSSQFWIDLGALTGQVVATDGHPVRPVAGSSFPLAMAQRLDILIDLPQAGAFPILARLEGSMRQTGIVLATAGAQVSRIPDVATPVPALDHSLETRLAAATPLPARQADLVRTIVLDGGMKPYAWSMNGAYWPQTTPLMVRKGQRVEIELVNHSMMAHPIHLHGHAFQVIAIDGRPVQGAVRDTVLVKPMMGRVRIAFDADNPGRWAFHCHNLYHMMTGMMMEFRYEGIAA